MRLKSVPAETAAMPGFLTANYVITGAWTAAALLMMAANIALLYFPGLPLWSGLAVAFAARNSAIYFTKWYPEYRQIKYGTPAARAAPPPAEQDQTMKDVFARLASDFLSAIVFLVVYLVTDNVVLATVSGDCRRDRAGDLRRASRASSSAT